MLEIDTDLILGLGWSPGEGNGNWLQYSCLENSMDRGAWWATVHGVVKELNTAEQLRMHAQASGSILMIRNPKLLAELYPPQIIHWSLTYSTPECDSMVVLAERANKDVIKLKLGWTLTWLDWCPYNKRKYRHTERDAKDVYAQRKPSEDTARVWPSGSQGEKREKSPALPTPWSWTSGHQNREEINFCCLRHSACVILLWQP